MQLKKASGLKNESFEASKEKTKKRGARRRTKKVAFGSRRSEWGAT